MVEDFTDTYGDVANVYTLSGRVFVGIVTDPGTRYETATELSFTPGEARKFFKSVKRAAKAAKALEAAKRNR
jgi:hypothetical protein